MGEGWDGPCLPTPPPNLGPLCGPSPQGEGDSSCCFFPGPPAGMTQPGSRAYSPLMSRHHPALLETVSVTVPEAATEAYEAALASACASVGFFRDHATGDWRVEGVKEVAAGDDALTAALALAEGLTGVAATLERQPTPAEGWLARTQASFPEQHIGRRFAVRGHASDRAADAGAHHADPGCRAGLRLRRAWLDPRLPARAGRRGAPAAAPHPGYGHRLGHSGDGGGAAAAAPRAGDRYRAVVGARHRAECPAEPAIAPGPGAVGGWLAERRGPRAAGPMTWCLPTSWRARSARWRTTSPPTSRRAARPSCPGCWQTQARWVLAAHRRQGLRLERRLTEGVWTTLVLRR